jgi:hypothetical protein
MVLDIVFGITLWTKRFQRGAEGGEHREGGENRQRNGQQRHQRKHGGESQAAGHLGTLSSRRRRRANITRSRTSAQDNERTVAMLDWQLRDKYWKTGRIIFSDMYKNQNPRGTRVPIRQSAL